jgi:oxygen-independent coproporphyrinogen-3 oxidase
LHAAGVTRLSIGVQSFHDAYLAPLGRIHSGEEAWGTLATVSRSGFANVNTDLMFGFPGQSLEEVLTDIRRVAEFGFSHLSLYSLTAEPATPFFREVRDGRVALPPLDLQHAMMTEAWALLASLGFHQYEVSNFYREAGGTPCRHNLRYWDYGSFLGLGAGATGFLQDVVPTREVWGRRYMNARPPEAYLQGVAQGAYGAEESIDEATAVNEWFMMGLRKTEGIRIAEFARLFPSRDFDADYGKRCAQLGEQGLLSSERGCIRTSRRGLEILDDLIAKFWL